MVELFRDFWWLVFPVFGMVMAVLGMNTHNQREALRREIARAERKP